MQFLQATRPYRVTATILEKKMERNQEDEADQLGMLIAAEAGYHPDYAIFAARTMRSETGDASKFMAFFSEIIPDGRQGKNISSQL